MTDTEEAKYNEAYRKGFDDGAKGHHDNPYSRVDQYGLFAGYNRGWYAGQQTRKRETTGGKRDG